MSRKTESSKMVADSEHQMPSRRNVHPQRPRFVGHHCQHLPASLMASRRRPNHCQQRTISQHRPLTASWDGRWFPLDATGLHQSDVQDGCSSKSRTMTLFSLLQIQCAIGMQLVLQTDQASRWHSVGWIVYAITNEPFQQSAMLQLNIDVLVRECCAHPRSTDLNWWARNILQLELRQKT